MKRFFIVVLICTTILSGCVWSLDKFDIARIDRQQILRTAESAVNTIIEFAKLDPDADKDRIKAIELQAFLLFEGLRDFI